VKNEKDFESCIALFGAQRRIKNLVFVLPLECFTCSIDTKIENKHIE
jgi:hypothetical protein